MSMEKAWHWLDVMYGCAIVAILVLLFVAIPMAVVTGSLLWYLVVAPFALAEIVFGGISIWHSGHAG